MFNIVPYNQYARNDLRRAGNYNDLYNIFDDFWGNSLMRNNNLRDVFKVDVTENENEYLIEADLPGVKKEEIDLKIDDNALIISVSHEDEKSSEDKNYLHKERYVSSMKRRINLEASKINDISAKLEDGVLSIVVPKEDPSKQSRKIEIN